MPAIQNQDSARPQFLYIIAGAMTAVCIWIFLAAETDQTRAAACLLWAVSGLPLCAAGVVRAHVLKRRGETLLHVEPSPLVFGQSFSGYIESGSSLDLSTAAIKLQATHGRRSAWESGNLKRGVSASAAGRQRLEFSGTLPNASELWWSYPENSYWSVRFTTGLLNRILPAEFPVSVTRPQAAVVASPKYR
ncbi:MAG: hypothetical protein M3041_08370 [Acidobacteriota bacterium]|nr:hypothetical protein [Acidobacteriota bacterium]